MVAMARTITVQTFHYIPVDQQDLEGAVLHSSVQNRRINVSLPDFTVYDISTSPDSRHDLFSDEDPEELLKVVQYHKVDGERSNITHTLRPEEWLVEDHEAEGGYRVLTGRQLHYFLEGRSDYATR